MAATGAGEALFQRRIEFHPARRSDGAPGGIVGAGWNVETLNPSEEAPWPQRKRNEFWEGREELERERGEDPELCFSIKFQKIGAGLANLGNTCYLNSVLQCLTYTEPFAAYLQSGMHKSSCRRSGFCAMCALQSHVMTALQSTGKILSPSLLVKNLRSISRNFRNSRQEDAHEYMVNLLESMHKCCLPYGVPSESPNAYEKSLVHRIFGGLLRSQVECMDCRYSSNKFDPFLDLSLEIDKSDSVQKALLHFTAFEELDGGQRQYQCQRCKHKVRAKKRLTVHKAPRVLTIHLKRFGIHVPGQKIDKKIKFEQTLDLKPFVSDQQEGDLKYTLYGVLVHAGWSTHSGHYYCYVRTSTGLWYSLNDNQVSPVGEKVVLEQKAYMLFYIRDRSLSLKRPLSSVSKEHITLNSYGNGLLASSQFSKAAVQLGPVEKKIHTFERSTFTANTFINKHVSTNIASLGNSLMKEACLPQQHAQISPNEASASHPNVNQSNPLQQLNGQCALEAITTSSARSYAEPRSMENEGGKTAIESSISFMLKNYDPSVESEQKNPTISKQTVKGSLSASGSQITLHNGFSSLMSSKHLTVENIVSANKSASENSAGQRVSTLFQDHNVNASNERVLEAANSENAFFKENGIDDHASRQPTIANDNLPVSLLAASEAPSIHNNGGMPEKHMKRTKHSRRRIVHLGARHLLLASWSSRKRKHKRCKKKCSSTSKSVLDDQEPSTSEAVYNIDSDMAQSTQKRSKHSKKSNEKKSRKDHRDAEVVSSLDKVNEGNPGVGKTENIEELASFKQSKASLNMHTSQGVGRQMQTHDVRTSEVSLVKMLMRGLSEVQVPRWGDTELPSSQIFEPKVKRNRSIGYVLDEWDEEYDRGKRRKIKTSSQASGGSTNPFQEIASRDVQREMKKKLKLDRYRAGGEPFRI